MAGRFRSAAPGGVRRRQAALLSMALVLACVLAYKYSTALSPAASSVSGAAVQSQAQSLLSSLTSQLSSSGGSGGGFGVSSEDGSSKDSSSGSDSSQKDSGTGSTKASRKAGAGATGKQRQQQRKGGGLALPPVAEPDPGVVKQRCSLAKGDWCGRYDAQQPIPARPPPRGNLSCLWGPEPMQCNFVGVCDASAGWCRCPAGWNGDDCSTRMKRPCSQFVRTHGFEPFNQPVDFNHGAGTTLACADLCDEDIGACYCNSTFAHGRIPADPHQPPGTPPQRRGRPIFHFCRRSEPAGWGDVHPDMLYGTDGWCQAEHPHFSCGCIADGWGGPTCETPYEQFCLNQCNGHGECQGGFCKCHTGWYGQDCAFRTAGTPWTPGMEEGERPWLKAHVHAPAARDPEPGQTRRRPLIYVYELPPFYNAVMLQYRVSKDDCVHRLFDESNSTRFNDQYLYNPEPGLHEMLLQSEHRTLDPEEADYFYVPVYTSCFIFPVLSATDFPYIHGGPVAWRTHAAANLMIEVYHWIRSHHPYWDRNGGRDHLLLSVHDEGSCWVPAVFRPATILSHWGRTDFLHVSGTGFWPDNYTADSHHPVWQPEGHVGKLGDFPCYDPQKDLVLPPMMSPAKFQESPLMGAPARERSILGFFKGRTQQDNPPYSRGTRQYLENVTRDEGWWDKHKIWFGQQGPPGETLSYSEFLASSIFCFAMMGDGWAARYEYAMLHGCIPVIIQDGVEMAWHSLLDVPAYSVRIAQKDMARIPEILKAIAPEEIERMQKNLALVWRRHMWTGYRPYGELARQLLDSRREAAKQAEVKSQPAPAVDYDPAEDDALSTLMQALYARVDERGAHAKGQQSGGASARR